MPWEDLEGVGGEGGRRGIGMGKTCEPKGFSFQCMTKFTTNKKKEKKEEEIKATKEKRITQSPKGANNEKWEWLW